MESESLHLSPVDFKARFAFEKPTVEDKLIFYCKSGIRSAKACSMLEKAGYLHVKNYAGSWSEWSES